MKDADICHTVCVCVWCFPSQRYILIVHKNVLCPLSKAATVHQKNLILSFFYSFKTCIEPCRTQKRILRNLHIKWTSMSINVVANVVFCVLQKKVPQVWNEMSDFNFFGRTLTLWSLRLVLSGFWWTAVSDCGQYRPNNRVIDTPLLRLVTEDIEKLTAKHLLNITMKRICQPVKLENTACRVQTSGIIRLNAFLI